MPTLKPPIPMVRDLERTPRERRDINFFISAMGQGLNFGLGRFLERSVHPRSPLRPGDDLTSTEFTRSSTGADEGTTVAPCRVGAQ